MEKVTRKTKIVATLGPASDKEHVLEKMIEKGVNVVRINMSHGTKEEQQNRILKTRDIAKKLKVEVGVLVDLQGPKIRISKFKEKMVVLKEGNKFILDANLEDNAGDENQVGIDYKNLVNDVRIGDEILLDDGRLSLDVTDLEDSKIITVVRVGGELSNNKGINRKGGGLSAKALTEKDYSDIKFACENNADFVAVSFPRSGEDILTVKKELVKYNSNAAVVAKIERVEAVEALEEIISCSDVVMVARGDLGVEIGFADLPSVQKRIINLARTLDTAVITATQMMESMITNSIPTRAEVSDVANAVIEGTDAVMLSAETAAGRYPVEVVSAMSEVCIAAERREETQQSNHRLNHEFQRVDEAIAMAAMYSANHMEVKAIVALTESGATPLMMSRIRSSIPIYGVSSHKEARGRMTIYRGVYPIEFDLTKYKKWEVIRAVIVALRGQDLISSNDRIIVTRGDVTGVSGGANSLKILTVE